MMTIVASPGSAERSPRRSRSIRARLMLLVVALVIPGWLGIAAGLYTLYQTERRHIALGTITTARTVLGAVDRELSDTIVAVRYLAKSPALASDDLAAFQIEAANLSLSTIASHFVLALPSGQELVNTLLPYGSSLPQLGSLAGQRKMLETGLPSISDVFIGPVTNEEQIAITVPVLRDGKVKYSLSAKIRSDNLIKLLTGPKLPSDWIAAIVDAHSVIAARTHNRERFVGQKAAPALLAAMTRSGEGVVEMKSVEGIPVFAAYSRSELSNWTVAIAIPIAQLSAVLNFVLLLGSALALLLLAAGLALARHQSDQIARAVQSLIVPALALGRGEVPVTQRLNVQEADEVARALGRAYEIMQSRAAERDGARLNEAEAKTLTAMMDGFVANVSHELRIPLTSIEASLGLLAGGAGGPLPATAARMIAIASTNSQRLLRLINDLLDIGKIESGNLMLNFAPVDLRAAAVQAIDAIGAFAQAHGVSIRFDMSSPDCLVRADADRVIQIFTNLVSNAIKFSPDGGEVVVSLKHDQRSGYILVRDHGPGIPEEFKARIFSKFAQAETGDARQRSGTGLGLNIVAKIVSQHGGIVGFEDAPGGGTVFQVQLPLWNAEKIRATAA